MRYVIAVIVVCFLISGCGQNKGPVITSDSDTDGVIKIATSMSNDGDRTDYLVKQSKAFHDSGEYRKAIYIARYILDNLDANLKSAKDILEKSEAKLK